jgi:hypothetical protein
MNRPCPPARRSGGKAHVQEPSLSWTNASQKTSGRTFPTVCFGRLSVERLPNKFYGIDCNPDLGAKLLDRFFHRRRQISPIVNNATHCFFDRAHHIRHCNVTVGSRHSAVASSSGDKVSGGHATIGPLHGGSSGLVDGSRRRFLRRRVSIPRRAKIELIAPLR